MFFWRLRHQMDDQYILCCGVGGGQNMRGGWFMDLPMYLPLLLSEYEGTSTTVLTPVCGSKEFTVYSPLAIVFWVFLFIIVWPQDFFLLFFFIVRRLAHRFTSVKTKKKEVKEISPRKNIKNTPKPGGRDYNKIVHSSQGISHFLNEVDSLKNAKCR